MIEVPFNQLNKYMSNMGSPQFNYDTLKLAFDSDPRIAELISDFTQNLITLKTSEIDDINSAPTTSRTTVNQMAKRATDLGSKL